MIMQRLKLRLIRLLKQLISEKKWLLVVIVLAVLIAVLLFIFKVNIDQVLGIIDSLF